MNNKISFEKIFIKNYQCLLVTFLCSIFCFFAQAQETQIGIEYYKAKEYEKAKNVFEKLAKDKGKVDEIHEYYLETLITLNMLDEADKFLKKQIKHSKGKPSYYLDLGEVYEKQNKLKESKTAFEKGISLVANNDFEANELAKHFQQIGKTDYAIYTLLLVRKNHNSNSLFSNELAKLYKATGKTAEMINEYLIYSESEANLDYFKMIIQDDIKSEKDIIILEKVLYENVQKYPDSSFFTEALIGYLVNQKLFFKAYLQARSLDKRLKFFD